MKKLLTALAAMMMLVTMTMVPFTALASEDYELEIDIMVALYNPVDMKMNS